MSIHASENHASRKRRCAALRIERRASLGRTKDALTLEFAASCLPNRSAGPCSGTHSRLIATVNAPSRLMPQSASSGYVASLESGSCVSTTSDAACRRHQPRQAFFSVSLHHRHWHLDRLPDGGRLPGHGQSGVGRRGENARWSAFVEKAAAGSVHAAEMPFVNADAATASIAGSGMAAPGIGKVSLRAKVANPDSRRGPYRPLRQEGPHRPYRARRAAKNLRRRLDLQAHQPACRPEDGGGQDGLRRVRYPRQGSRDRQRLLHEEDRSAIRACRPSSPA